MKRKIVGVVLALLSAYALAMGALPARGDQDTPNAFTVDAAGQARFGVTVITLKAATAPGGSSTTARVLDPGSLLELDSEVTAASAGLAASRAEAERTRKLFAQDRTASARAVEAANAQEQADLQRVAGPQRRLALEWGRGIADLPAKRRTALLNDLAHSRAALVRVEMPSGMVVPKAGATIRFRGSVDSGAFAGIVLGALPLADTRLQTRGVLVELTGDAANLPIGQMLVADVPTASAAVEAVPGTTAGAVPGATAGAAPASSVAPAAAATAGAVAPSPAAQGHSGAGSGVILPRSALLRRDSRVWVYVQTSPTTFVRREVRGYRPDAAGWFVVDGFAAGDRVVAAGAAALLGVESPAAADADSDPDGH